jgi:hypothetical protein
MAMVMQDIARVITKMIRRNPDSKNSLNYLKENDS